MSHLGSTVAKWANGKGGASAGQGRAGQGRAGQGRARQGRAERGRACVLEAPLLNERELSLRIRENV